jgi:hypothetical protein
MRKLPAKIYKWRWVPTLYGFIRIPLDFIIWMGWGSLMLTAAIAFVGGLLTWLENPDNWVRIFFAFLIAASLSVLGQFLFWRAKAHKVLVSAATVERPTKGAAPGWVASKRISFVDFLTIAASEHGWDFSSYSSGASELTSAVSQAAIDKDIELDGRQLGFDRVFPVTEDIKNLYPLIPIPADHFVGWHILAANVNWEVETVNRQDYDDKRGYRDLHFRDRTRAVSWLASINPRPQPDTCVDAVIDHVANYSSVQNLDEAVSAIEGAARDGQIEISGKSTIDDEYISIEYRKLGKRFWEAGRLDRSSFEIFGGAPKSHWLKKAVPNTQGAQWYVKLRTNGEKILELWPPNRHGSPLERRPVRKAE